MTQDERFLARLMFINRLLRSNGDVFQQLFWAVMRATHGQDFVEIKPQGSLGDGGNDGYLPALGHYYQVYGPVDPQNKITEAANKLAVDFEKIKSSWSQATPMQAYSFVFNDKYEGVFKTIGQALGELEKSNPTVKCRPLTAAHLEDAFMQLPPDKVFAVLGTMFPDTAKLAQLDYGVLKEVIAHIMNAPVTDAPTRFGSLPELGDKIQLNKLSGVWGGVIESGARQSGHLDQYFSKNSHFAKQALRDHLVERYRRARDEGRALSVLPDGVSREDLIFSNFRESLLPVNATFAADAAVKVIIGYYFESCDIFDPYSEKDFPGASA